MNPNFESKLMTLLDDHRSEIIELRRYLHEHPEVSFHEKNTAAFIKDYYSNLDCKMRDCGDGYGIVVDINPDKPGKSWLGELTSMASLFKKIITCYSSRRIQVSCMLAVTMVTPHTY